MNRKQRRKLRFRNSMSKVETRTGEFKVVSKSGAVITLIEVNLPSKRLKNLSIGSAKLEKVR
jgi:hypothetical protein